MGKELIKVEENTIVAIEEACELCAPARLQALSPIRRMLTVAQAMGIIRRHMQGPLMADIMALRDTPLGFLTDRKSGTDDDGKPVKPYSEEQIRDIVIEGLLRGASVVGNEINGLVGRCYLTKQYFERMVRDFPGLSDFKLFPGVPMTSTSAQSALVPMRATWRLQGQAQELRCDHTPDGDYRIPVRVNKGATPDNIIGKATRKFLARVYGQLTGSAWAAEQAELEDAPKLGGPLEAKPEGLGVAVLQSAAATLDTLEQITQVDEYQAQAIVNLDNDAQRSLLVDLCDARRDMIRQSRGERSNAQE